MYKLEVLAGVVLLLLCVFTVDASVAPAKKLTNPKPLAKEGGDLNVNKPTSLDSSFSFFHVANSKKMDLFEANIEFTCPNYYGCGDYGCEDPPFSFCFACSYGAPDGCICTNEDVNPCKNAAAKPIVSFTVGMSMIGLGLLCILFQLM